MRAGAVAVAGGALGTGTARAAAPTPTPQDDDVAYLQFGATAELVAVSLGAELLLSTVLTPADKRRIRALRDNTKLHRDRLSAVLGADAPQYGDFAIKLPAATGREEALGKALELANLIAGTYAAGVADVTDPATRTLLGRLLWSQAQHLSALRVLLGQPAAASGLPGGISLDDAGPRLDAYLADLEPPA